MPDGYAFELKIAERMRVLGWVCEMTPASNDFGADLFCRVGDEFIVLQCKCYDDASSIGVAAVQEVCTAARHFGAGLGLVVYEGRPSRSAKSLAQSVGVRLFHADELVAGWEFDRTAKGTVLRIKHLEQKEAAEAAAQMREKAIRLEGYRLDREAYLNRMKEWNVNQTLWGKKSKSWRGGWVEGVTVAALVGALVLVSGRPSSDALLGLGLLVIAAVIFFTKHPGSAPAKPIPPVPIEEADTTLRAGSSKTMPSNVGAFSKPRDGGRVIIRCSRCETQLRVPAATRLRIGCPRCGLSEVRNTPPGSLFD